MKRRIPYHFFSVCVILLFFSYEMKADGGEVLERIISLPKMKGTVYTLLGKVSEQSGYLFIYDSKLVRNDSIAKIKKGERSVRQAIYDITGNSHLNLKVVGKHILITPSLEKKAIAAVPVATEPIIHTLTGVLLDGQTGDPISYASVVLRKSATGSVTNQNGEFRIHVPDSVLHSTVVFSHLGYITQELDVSALLGWNNTLSLEPEVISLQEVLIRVVDPKKLLCEMLEKRSENYFSEPVYLTTFYREGVQLKKRFQRLTEAVFKVYKPSIQNEFATDQVKLLKMSRIDNLDSKDSLRVKISAGISACLQLDIMKSLPDFLTAGLEEDVFDYTFGGVTYVDNRCVNIVRFEQKKNISDPLFCGELYIDSENSALLQAQIEIQPKYIKKAANIFVIKKSRDINLIPQKVTYTISYRPSEQTYYIHHIRGDLYFKTGRKKLSFSGTSFHTWFEMVTCKVDKEQVAPFPRTDRLPTRTVFSDINFKYDQNFWEDFNIIPLEEDLSRDIEKITLKIEKTSSF